MKTRILGFALFIATAATVAFYPSVRAGVITDVPAPAPVDQVQANRIEVVFVLDTTNSMANLIDAAKEKIWSIATTLAQSPSAPEISMGLVAFRDRGDAYVTKVVDLSQDLDTMYAKLMDFSAQGGGDGPESVNAALDAAINQISWSEQDNSYKVVFLVGDAPPHMDYSERQYPELVGLATQKGILVNTIRCGDNPATQQHWQTIASIGGGDYFSVGQSGDAIAITTPFDDQIAALSRELDETRLVFGSEDDKEEYKQKKAATDKLHAEASAASRARRATFNASASGADNLFGDTDLVDAVVTGEASLDAIAVEELPAALQKMSLVEREEAVGEVQAQRLDLGGRIAELAQKRDSYLEQQVAESEGVEDSFDYRLYDTLKSQGAGKGIMYEAAAPKL